MIQAQQLYLRASESIAPKIHSLITSKIDKIDSIEMVASLELQEGTTDCFTFSLNGSKYPALLLNLPTVVETQKTFDRKIFYKSGDIGQILYVFETEQERDKMKNKNVRTRHGEQYCVNGITSATENIVKNRFELVHKSTDIYPIEKVNTVVTDIMNFMTIEEKQALNITTSSSKGGVGASSSSSSSSTAQSSSNVPPDTVEIITEEIVEFEEWMIPSDESIVPEIGLTYKVESSDWGGDMGILTQYPYILDHPHPGNLFIIK